MSIYDVFPADVWVNILFELPCKNIKELCNNFIAFKELCIKDNIIQRVKFKCFPRKEGVCKIHDLTNIFDNNLTERSLENNNNKIFEILLEYLINNKIDVIRGDIIITDDTEYIYMFDGEKIITGDHSRDVYTGFKKHFLPHQLSLLTNNMPINYYNPLISFYPYMDYYVHLRFDIGGIKEQCLNNIKVDGRGIIETYFKYDNKNYYLRFNDIIPIHILGDRLNDFRNLLNKYNNITVRLDDDDNFMITPSCEKRTLLEH